MTIEQLIEGAKEFDCRDKEEAALFGVFLRSAIETAFREVRPIDKFPVLEEDGKPDSSNYITAGYQAALADLDENIAKYLGK